MQTVVLPYSLRIGPSDITINRDGVELTDDHVGEFRTRSGDIVIDMTQEPIQIADTYLHEIMHAIWRNGHLGDMAVEEAAVAVLATGFLALMRDNPECLDPVWEAFAIRRRQRLAHDLRCEGAFS